MEKCAGCHWHCTGIRRCKSIHSAPKEVECSILEAGMYSMPGNFQVSIKCKQLISETSESATA